MRFEAFDWRELSENVFTLVSKDWMLITAALPPGEARKAKEDGTGSAAWNTMTASWGGFGHLWNRDVAFVFVRPTRYTYRFMESSKGFTLSFFGEERRKALQICGAVSGREHDKAAMAGLTPRDFGSPDSGWTAFEEARLVLGCTTVHSQDLDPRGFIDPSIASNYDNRDGHRLYVGAIEAAWKGIPE